MIVLFFSVILFSYLLGSISFSYLIAKKIKKLIYVHREVEMLGQQTRCEF